MNPLLRLAVGEVITSPLAVMYKCTMFDTIYHIPHPAAFANHTPYGLFKDVLVVGVSQLLQWSSCLFDLI